MDKSIHDGITKHTPVLGHSNEGWVLVERYVNTFNPPDFRLVFKREDVILQITVPEEAWRAFDGVKNEGVISPETKTGEHNWVHDRIKSGD